MQIPPPPIRAGDGVRVRRQRWRVSVVRSHGACTFVTLTGIDRLNSGAEKRVIAPFDLVEPLERPQGLRMVGVRRWRRLCRALLVNHGSSRMLRTAVYARIDLLAHQLEPALAIAGGLGSRVLIADEVGLGKTIQAGLIVSELIARGAADRVLVLAPAGLREQWAHELRDKFGLNAVVVDMQDVRRRAAAWPARVNPWSTVSLAIASVDFVKRPEVLPVVRSCRWDAVIVDEAHGVTPGSERREAVDALCGAAPYVVLLTATPHSGDRECFASLCALGQQNDDGLLVFRRSRAEVSLGGRRRIHLLRVRPSADELRMHAMLARLTQAVCAARKDRDREVWLALTTLHKRALSSARSLEHSVRGRLARLPSGADASSQLCLPLDDPGGELDSSDAPPEFGAPLLDEAEQEHRLLAALADAARTAARRETKLSAIGRLIARIRNRDERAIVFTEYRDTLCHVLAHLPVRCAVLHGGLTREARRAALDEFTSGRRPVLLATDAAGEGLNLHHACRVVINLELPWNPVRLEQRAGRVDRIGQKRTVHAFHLIAHDTGEARVLERLRARVARARQDIDIADPIGGGEDQEHWVARLVVGGDGCEAIDAKRSSRDITGMQVVRLAQEADREHAHLADARTWRGSLGADDCLVSASGLMGAVDRRRRTRLVLGSRLLMLSRSTLDDGAGRQVASHVSAFLVVPMSRIGHHRPRNALAAQVDAIQSADLETIDPSFTDWKTESHRQHRTFWETRLAREHAIARAPAPDSSGFQPGLFDRRAERRHAETERRRAELAAEAERHIAAAERAGALATPSTRVALVLVP